MGIFTTEGTENTEPFLHVQFQDWERESATRKRMMGERSRPSRLNTFAYPWACGFQIRVPSASFFGISPTSSHLRPGSLRSTCKRMVSWNRPE